MPLRHRVGLLLTALLLLVVAFACDSNGNSLVPGASRPRVVVNVTPADPIPGLPIVIDASGSSDDGGIVRFDITLRTGSGQTVTFITGRQNRLEVTLGAGTYSATVMAVDAQGEASSRTINFVVSDCGPSPVVTTTTLPDALEGSFYSTEILATGGVDPLKVSLATGYTLPPGLSLQENGTLSGTPALGTAGSYFLQVVIEDSCDVAPRKANISLPLVIAANPGGCPPLTIDSDTAPDGKVGTTYSFSLSASGGLPPVTWDIASGALPPGILLLSDTLTGIPSAASVYVVGIRAQDSCVPSPQSAVQSYTITVNP